MGNLLIKMKPGIRVVRGPDWTYEDQDGGEGHVGTVVEIGGQSGSQTPEKHVTVVWDSGARHQYRAGHEEAYDLHVYDSAPCGVVHIKPCSACLTPFICGLRWTCSQCPLIHLCTGCYMKDLHDTSHPFERFETDSPGGISVPSRSDSCADKIEAKGIFNGATVTRGPDWQWDNQDGGEGRTGKVVTSGRWVNVEWEMGDKNKYRLGDDGKVDLKCVAATSGGVYYKGHLPILGNRTEVDGLPETHEDSWADATSSDSDDDTTTDSDLMLASDTEDDDSDDDDDDDDGDEASEEDAATSTETYDVTDACLGLRVVRGPGWKWKNQDGGEGHVGTVVETPGMGLLASSWKHVTVLWDSGHQSVCRVGQSGQFDLLVFDNAQINVEHDGIRCDGCQHKPIQGIRWKCTVCEDFDLCAKCYGRDVHDLGHRFWRFENPSDKIPCRVPKRLYSQKVQAMGIAEGAKVVRGRDWAWQEQDGGDGKKGRVIDIGDSKDELTKGLIRVEWTNGFINNYRLGKDGKLDLKCIKATAAGFYYRDHLPVLGRCDVKKSAYNMGDKVKCKFDTETFKDTHDGRSSDTVAQYVKHVGTVYDICYDGQIKVCYEDGSKFTYHPDTLMKLWLNSSDVTALLHERRAQRCNDGTSVDPPLAESSDYNEPVMGERTMCAVCAMKESQAAFVPCGHLICCPDCAVVQRNCPICAAEIEQLLLTFIS